MTEMTPRTRLAAVPYAYRVSTIDSATGGAISGNINLELSTATTGNILKDGVPFIHTFPGNNTFVGMYAGNLTMTGTSNTAIGKWTLLANTTGSSNTVSGDYALAANISGNVNTASGLQSLSQNTSGSGNTASGLNSLYNNKTGDFNTAMGFGALESNTTGSYNTAIGYAASTNAGALTNATAIGSGAVVDASNKIRLGDAAVTVIEGQVAYTFTSDKNEKENFQAVDGAEVLRKIQDLEVTSWNYIGQDPEQFRHYGPVAQEFFAAFGHDGVGTCGDSTTINTGDLAGILMIAVQALEKRTTEVETLRSEIQELKVLVQRTAVDKNQITGVR